MATPIQTYEYGQQGANALQSGDAAETRIDIGDITGGVGSVLSIDGSGKVATDYTIDDTGSSTTDLFSASKILSLIPAAPTTLTFTSTATSFETAFSLDLSGSPFLPFVGPTVDTFLIDCKITGVDPTGVDYGTYYVRIGAVIDSGGLQAPNGSTILTISETVSTWRLRVQTTTGAARGLGNFTSIQTRTTIIGTEWTLEYTIFKVST